MTVINQNSISGITSITAASGSVQIFNSDGSSGSLTDLSGVNVVGVVTATTYNVSAGSTSAPSISPTGDSNTGIFFPSADTIAFGEGGAEVARIDSSGRLLVGTSTARSNFFNTSASAALQIEGLGGTGDSRRLAVVSSENSNLGGGGVVLAHQRSGAVGGNTIVQNGDQNGSISFQGNDGAQFVETARIEAYVDGTPGADDMPGRLVFSTTADGASSPTERMRLTSTGALGLGTGSPSYRLHVVGGQVRIEETASTSDGVLWLKGSTTNNGGAISGVNSSDGAGPLKFYNGSTEAARFDTSGRLGIGTTSPGDSLSLGNGLSAGFNANASGNTTRLRWRYEGTEYAWIERVNSDGSLAFGAQSSERMRIDPSGRLLVGTSSARTNIIGDTATLQVEGTSYATSSLAITRNSNSAGTVAGFVLAKSRGTSTGSNTVVQSGDALGEIYFAGADGTNLVQAGSIRGEVDGTPGSNDMPGRLVFSTTADGASSPTERMRIASGGSVLVNDTALRDLNGQSFQVSGYAMFYQPNTGTAASVFTHTGSGTQTLAVFRQGAPAASVGSITVSGGASTAYNTSSDYRLKENVVPLTGAIDRLSQLQVHRFNFIANPGKTVDGFIAHEAQAVVPEAVTGSKDEVDADGNPVYQGIDQSKLVPLLTAALQEAIAKIETLEARLTAIEP